MSSTAPRKEFKFFVNPREPLEERELRWDKWMSELASEGLAIQGVGPDGDYPIRYAFGEDPELSFDEWWTGNPDAPWFEVYNTVPLEVEADAREIEKVTV